MTYWVVIFAASAASVAAGGFAASGSPYALGAAVYAGLLAIITAIWYEP